MGIRVRGQPGPGSSTHVPLLLIVPAMPLQSVCDAAPGGGARRRSEAGLCAIAEEPEGQEDMQSTLGRIDTPSNPEPAIHDQVNFFNSDVENIKHSLAKYGCH